MCQGSSPLLQRRTAEIKFEALGYIGGRNLAKQKRGWGYIYILGIIGSNASYEHIRFLERFDGAVIFGCFLL